MQKIIFPAIAGFLLISFFGPTVTSRQIQRAADQETPPLVPVQKQVDKVPLNIHQWGAVSLLHGLPSDRVNAITEDASGALWFGTDNGLVRYDGRKTEAFGAAGDSRGVLPSQRIRALLKDNSGQIWIGTDQGAVRLNGGRISNLDPTASFSISAISESNDGRIALVSDQGTIFVCSGRNSGILREGAQTSGNLSWSIIDGRNATLLNARDSAISLNSVAFDAPRRQWLIGSQRRGLLVLNDNQQVAAYDGNKSGPYFVNAIYQSSHGVWFGAAVGRNIAGLWRQSEGGTQRVSALTGPVNAIHGLAKDVWVATESSGAFLFRDGVSIEHATIESTNGGLRSNRILAVYLDHEGVAWFGTDRGVCRYDRDSVRAEILAEEPQANFVRSIATTAGGEVFAGTNRGLFERANDIWRRVPELGDRRVYSILASPKGKMWIGTDNGIFVRNSGSYARIGTPVSIRSLGLVGSNTVLALGFREGRSSVYRVTDSGIVAADDLFPGATITSLYFAPGEAVVTAGTARGEVIRADGRDGRIISNVAIGSGNELIRAIYVHGDVAWVGTGDGLYRRDSSGTVKIVSSLDVQSILAIGGRVFCATRNAGLIQVREDNTSLRGSLDNESGLPTRQCFALAAGSEGEIWIGTNRGVARHLPVKADPILEPRRLVADLIYSADYMATELRFPGSQKNYLLEVMGIGSRTFPSQFQYEYVVNEEAKGEIRRLVTSDPQLNLVGLEEGRYTITARAISRDLGFSQPFRLKLWISREPVSLSTILLSGLLLVVTVVGGYALFQQRRTAIVNRELESTNRELHDTRIRLANITESERNSIARDLHDQTLADLRHLLVMTDQMGGTGPERTQPAELRRKIEDVSSEIRHICEDLSPSVLTNAGFVPALEWALGDAVSHQLQDQKFAREFDCDQDLEDRLTLSSTQSIQVYRIIQEAINNVIKHARAKRVKLEVREVEDAHLLITLTDDGIGMKGSGTNPNGHGMANIRSRANLIGARVDWENAAAGCRFTVLLQNVVKPRGPAIS